MNSLRCFAPVPGTVGKKGDDAGGSHVLGVPKRVIDQHGSPDGAAYFGLASLLGAFGSGVDVSEVEIGEVARAVAV